MMRFRWLLAFSGFDLPMRFPVFFFPALSARALKANGLVGFFFLGGIKHLSKKSENQKRPTRQTTMLSPFVSALIISMKWIYCRAFQYLWTYSRTSSYFYLLSFQVAPSFVSFTSKPYEASSSRIWSLVAQSLAALALALSCSNKSMACP